MTGFDAVSDAVFDRGSDAELDSDVATVPAGAIERIGARMLLLDPDDRVLLIEERGSADAQSWHHWLTPGGGVEAGESLVDAAIREVIEETGLRVQLPADADPVYRQRRLWDWAGHIYAQVDTIFAARVGGAFSPAPTALTAMEEQSVVGARWWTLEELRATSDVLIPAALPGLVQQVLAADRPSRPVVRTAGRMLVLDRDDRVLLISSLQSPGASAANWVAPGGGTEPGETPAQAAVRELREETGIVVDLPADAVPVAEERAVFFVGQWHLDQTDVYFCTRVDARPDIDCSGLTELEHDTVLAYRWWSAQELADTDDVYWPADLVATLTALSAGAFTGERLPRVP